MYNSQGMISIQVADNGRMDKDNIIIYLHIVKYYSPLEKENTTVCDNM